MTTVQRLRRALLLVALGLLVQFLCTLYWSPLTFIVFAALGLPLVVAGGARFWWTAFRLLRPLDVPLEEES